MGVTDPYLSLLKYPILLGQHKKSNKSSYLRYETTSISIICVSKFWNVEFSQIAFKIFPGTWKSLSLGVFDVSARDHNCLL